jgi:hypothetical protein
MKMGVCLKKREEGLRSWYLNQQESGGPEGYQGHPHMHIAAVASTHQHMPWRNWDLSTCALLERRPSVSRLETLADSLEDVVRRERWDSFENSMSWVIRACMQTNALYFRCNEAENGTSTSAKPAPRWAQFSRRLRGPWLHGAQ